MSTRHTNIERHAELDSTNSYAADAARRGVAEGLVVLADRQLGGRGRRGRRFVSPPGGLFCSLLCRPTLGREALHLVPSALGLAALDAIVAATGLVAALKWPNDIVVGAGKLAGILSEIVPGDPGFAVVVGIGVNLDWPAGWPLAGSEEAELLEGATTLALASGTAVTVDDLLVALLDAFERRYAALETPEGRAATMADWRGASATIGRRARVELEGRILSGRAHDIAEDGRLVLEHGGTFEYVEVGDVVHLRD